MKAEKNKETYQKILMYIFGFQKQRRKVNERVHKFPKLVKDTTKV